MTQGLSEQEREDVLTGLVAQALELRESGAAIDLKALCAGHEDLIRDVAEVLGLATSVPALQQGARGSDALAGRVLLGRYRLEERIGAGAMGTVYRARDLSLQRDVAVKLLQQALLGGPHAEARFAREGQVLASLAHAHIVPVHDRGTTEDGIAFLVLQLVAGGSLARWISAQEPGDDARFAKVARIGLELAEALAAAHARGVCHRDVKPSNVLLDAAGSAMLVDFGISARASDGALTATGTTLGTPWYMSPEQVRGRVGSEPGVDVYGLCATLWHAIALRPPYEGDATSVLARIPHEDPPALVKVSPRVPRDLAAIVEHGMERDLAKRYPGAAQLEADLRAFVAGLPVAARPVGAAGRIARAVRLRPARYAAAVLLVVAVVAAALGGPAFAAERVRARAALLRAKWIALPAMVTLEGRPEDRPDSDAAERDEALPAVEEILSVAPRDVPARLLKTALLLDSGKRDAAVAEVRDLAEQRRTPYLLGLAERYAKADPSKRGARAIDIEGLPAPTDAFDRYAEGFHRLRVREEQDLVLAEAALSKAAAEVWQARDLHLLALLAVANSKLPSRAEAEPFFRTALNEAVQLEEVYGTKTARTQHAIGAALLGLQRYGDAIGPLEESLRLRPDRHNVVHNLGLALFRVGRLAEAEKLLMRALELKPQLWNSRYTLAQLLLQRPEFEKALETAQALPVAGTDGVPWKREELIASIHLTWGIWALGGAEVDQAKSHGAAAIEALRAAKAAGDPRARGRETELAGSLSRSDLAAAWRLYARWVAEDPLHARPLFLLSRLLEDTDIPLEQVKDIRFLLLSLATAMAPNETELRTLRKRLMSSLPKIEPGK